MVNFSWVKMETSRKTGRGLTGLLLLLAMSILIACPAGAVDFEVAGAPLSFNGYLNQAVMFGDADEDKLTDYDTIGYFRQAVMQALLEFDYKPTYDTRLFVSGLLNVDWAYEILQNNSEWQEKNFDESKSELFVMNEAYSLLKECHFSWMPGNYIIRAGKQVVVWGETDAIRITDQVNPVDNRRGAGDLEFETSIIPIWLLKTEYYPEISSSWMYDLGLELIFNPNADFVGNWNNGTLGNEVAGIWAPYKYSNGYLVGGLNKDLTEPDRWDSEGYEYGGRLRSNIANSLITLSYFNGVSNSPVYELGSFGDFDFGKYTFKDTDVVNAAATGEHPRLKFFGATFLRDLEALDMSSIGISSPVMSMEALYGNDNKYEVATDRAGGTKIEKFDEIRYSVGFAWKVRLPWLNPTDTFTINPTFIHQKALDYPDYIDGWVKGAGGDGPMVSKDYKADGLYKNMYTISTLIYTFYSHAKWMPQIFWLHNIWDRESGDAIRCKLAYKPNSTWSFDTTAMIFTNDGMATMDNKDYISFTAKYQW